MFLRKIPIISGLIGCLVLSACQNMTAPLTGSSSPAAAKGEAGDLDPGAKTDEAEEFAAVPGPSPGGAASSEEGAPQVMAMRRSADGGEGRVPSPVIAFRESGGGTVPAPVSAEWIERIRANIRVIAFAGSSAQGWSNASEFFEKFWRQEIPLDVLKQAQIKYYEVDLPLEKSEAVTFTLDTQIDVVLSSFTQPGLYLIFAPDMGHAGIVCFPRTGWDNPDRLLKDPACPYYGEKIVPEQPPAPASGSREETILRSLDRRDIIRWLFQ